MWRIPGVKVWYLYFLIICICIVKMYFLLFLCLRSKSYKQYEYFLQKVIFIILFLIIYNHFLFFCSIWTIHLRPLWAALCMTWKMWHEATWSVTWSYSVDYQTAQNGCRTTATSKVELFMTIVNSFQPLTIFTKCSILDAAVVLDPTLITNFLLRETAF